MHVTFVVHALILAAVFTATGVPKVLRRPGMVARARGLRYSPASFQVIGALELLAVAGLLTGLAWRPAGVAAAGGLVVLLAGAVRAHRRVGDRPATWLPPAWLGLLAAATAVVGVLAGG